jgi:hypothetical protein
MCGEIPSDRPNECYGELGPMPGILTSAARGYVIARISGAMKS